MILTNIFVILCMVTIICMLGSLTWIVCMWWWSNKIEPKRIVNKSNRLKLESKYKLKVPLVKVKEVKDHIHDIMVKNAGGVK